ncbi:hypothetical protein CEW87_14005 [Parazoarcus communis]|uniref:Uncharacterized protein n=1 Tax=Parazoarcus communis TaxID=41977 RepID=A0A2U8H3T7_9RHOO|nr:hypothetical protein [Parazoarcus communis]AWI80374.1 hypothetical protein CEW87_14005 [Parazoarcus communis]
MSESTAFIADFYYVSHIETATIPFSRLSGILLQMHQGKKLTSNSLGFLKQQNLPGLYRHACGETTYDAYVEGLDAAYLSKAQAAKAANHAKEIEKKAREAQYVPRRPNRGSPKVTKELDREAERALRRKREREETEAVLKAQRERQAVWKEQRARNCELAAAAYQARVAIQQGIEPTSLELAQYFHVSHIASAMSSPVSELLKALYMGRLLTADELACLKQTVPDDLYRLAYGQLTFDIYVKVAKVVEAEAIAIKARNDALEAARLARESDPAYIAMMKTRALFEKYKIGLRDPSLELRMTELLEQIDTGTRLSKEDLVWLSTTARKYFTPPIRQEYHRLEAVFHASQYRRTQDPWSAINACGHFRKCEQPKAALELIGSISPERLKHPKVRSALHTTHGGVLRDLGERIKAIEMGEKAHVLMPQDYRPCTLLGAVYMEQRKFNEGQDWYEKARKRGAPEHGIDSELRSIYGQLDSAGREAMRRVLLAEDPHRYPWLNGAASQAGKKAAG